MILILLKNLQKPNESMKKEKKAPTLVMILNVIILNERQKVLNAFDSGIFVKGKQGKGLTSILDCLARVVKVYHHKQLKILTPKQML